MKLFIVIIIGILFLGCAKKPPQITPPPIPSQVQPKIEIEPPKPIVIPTYIYLGGGRPDPFVALIKPKEIVPSPTPRPVAPEVRYEVDIKTLRLSGLLWDKNECLALLHDGEGFGYILRKKHLYGPNFKRIKDVEGFIKNNEEVVLEQGPNQIRLRLPKPSKISLEERS